MEVEGSLLIIIPSDPLDDFELSITITLTSAGFELLVLQKGHILAGDLSIDLHSMTTTWASWSPGNNWQEELSCQRQLILIDKMN